MGYTPPQIQRNRTPPGSRVSIADTKNTSRWLWQCDHCGNIMDWALNRCGGCSAPRSVGPLATVSVNPDPLPPFNPTYQETWPGLSPKPQMAPIHLVSEGGQPNPVVIGIGVGFVFVILLSLIAYAAVGWPG